MVFEDMHHGQCQVALQPTCKSTVHASGVGLPDRDEGILHWVALGVQQGYIESQRHACLPLGDVCPEQNVVQVVRPLCQLSCECA